MVDKTDLAALAILLDCEIEDVIAAIQDGSLEDKIKEAQNS